MGNILNGVLTIIQPFHQQVFFSQAICSSDLSDCQQYHVSVQRVHQEPATHPYKVPLLVQSARCLPGHSGHLPVAARVCR